MWARPVGAQLLMIAESKAWLKPPVHLSGVFWHPMCVRTRHKTRHTGHETGDMRRLRLWVGALAIGAGTPWAAGCAHAAQASGTVAPLTAIGLRVRNDNFLDVDVYAISEGLATRLGTVTGNSRRNFVLDASMADGQDFRIVATPVGGNGRASTGTLAVSPGQLIDFTVGSTLRNSSVVIR